MKANRLLVAIALFFGMTASISAQDYVYTVIDIYGTRYSDQMMLFSIDGTTHGFDNGWDAPKMYGTYLAPQLFNIEPENYYQINSMDDVNNTYLGLKSGEDTTYTMVFTHVLVETKYKQLYLIDSVANKTIDIFATGTTYTFTTPKFSDVVRRFKIVTSNPVVVIPPVVPPVTTDTTVIVPPVVPPVIPPVTDSTTVTPPTTGGGTTVVPPSTNDKKDKDKKDNDKKDKDAKNKKDHKLKVTCNRNNIVVDNQWKERAEMQVYDAKTGKCKAKYMVAANGKSTIRTNVKSGAYIVTVITSKESISERVIINN